MSTTDRYFIDFSLFFEKNPVFLGKFAISVPIFCIFKVIFRGFSGFQHGSSRKN